MKRRWASLLTVVVLLIGVATAVGTRSQAGAFTGSDFHAGDIISDQVFYNSAAMNVAQIQVFLNSEYDGCAPGFTCLRDYQVATPTMAAEPQLCNGYTAAAAQTAAEIIGNVAVSCGVNPQVLLVLLQKESGLLTDTSPSYQSVTGFGCPDSTGCNSAYVGFFNQVYLAARQFKLYRLNPTNYSYVAGRSNFIPYSPNPGCGGSQVVIANQATAGLYDYTPYQPNSAALANLHGTGDSCSTYGNRNFWTYFRTWFGSTGDGNPGVTLQLTSPRRQSDLLGIKADGSLWYYRDNGTSTPYLSPALAGTSGFGAYQTVIAADVNGDGRADLIATKADGTMWFLKNNGTTPMFATPVQIGSNMQIYQTIMAANVNNDDLADLIATKSDGTLWYFQNNGTANPYSAPPVEIGMGGWQVYNRIVLGDVSGDGLADIIATKPDGSLWYYQNNGTATPFSAATEIGLSGWGAFNRVLLGDVNGDGLADVIATKANGSLWYYQNNGTTTPFSGAANIGIGGWQTFVTLIVANVHGDGRADVVATKPDGTLWYFQNSGGATPYSNPTEIGLGGWQTFDRLMLGDVNGDGLPDIVATKPDGTLWYYRNNGTTTPYGTPAEIGLGGWQAFDRLMLGDVNGDGRADIVATKPDGTLWYYQNNGTTTPYSNPTEIGLGGWQTFDRLMLGDVNGDGRADIVTTKPDGTLWYYQNNGTATPYSGPSEIGFGGWQALSTLIVSDVDGDGLADILATEPDGTLWYYQNNGTTAPYGQPTQIASGWNQYTAVL